MHKELFNEISERELKPIQIIVLALIMGVISFLVVCLIFYFINQSNVQTPVVNPHNFLNITFILALFSFAGYLSAIYIPEIIIKKKVNSFGGKEAQEIDTSEFMIIYKNYLIVKLALLESSALAGLILFMLTILNNLIYFEEEYWLSLIPALFFFYNSIFLFPTKEKISDFAKTKLS